MTSYTNTTAKTSVAYGNSSGMFVVVVVVVVVVVFVVVVFLSRGCDVPLEEFMSLIIIYSHARRELP